MPAGDRQYVRRALEYVSRINRQRRPRGSRLGAFFCFWRRARGPSAGPCHNQLAVFGAWVLLDPGQACYRSRRGFVERGMDDSGALTIDEFARRIEALISDAREEGLSDQAMIAGLEEAIRALKEDLS